MIRPLALLATTMFVAPAALAETRADPVPPTPVAATADDGASQSSSAPADSVHGERATDIIITAPFVRELDVLANKSVLTGDRLVQDIRPTIGETLTRLPGVSATSFAPGASRPVLRGFQGERVRVLTDGLGSLDVSNTSTDHGVTIDPLTAERIEVLRGPAVLLFGSQAIGGAVNVIDRRIPRAVPVKGFHVDALGTYGSAAEERSIGGAFDVAVTPNIVVHADGSYRRSNDLEVGGFVLSPQLRAEQLDLAAEERAEGELDAADEATELAGLRGAIPNSATETYTLGGGIALINDRGSLGFSAGYYDTNYGVPARPGAEHAHEGEAGDEGEGGEEEGPVTIDLKQFRADMRGEILVENGFIDRIRARVGYADYEHTEFEGREVGTRFFTDAFEGRVELVQSDGGDWRGVTGIQGFTRDFVAIGAEAFVPPNQTDQFGLFTVQEFDFGAVGVEIAGRYERTDVRSNSVRVGLEEDAPLVSVDRGFDTFSAALGLTYQASDTIRFGLTGSRAERAPSAEELFSNGPHVATQAFEVGNPGFDTEKSWGIEAFASGQLGPLNFKLNGYATWFDDFIFEFDTGLEQDELPLFQYAQSDARYVGFEAEVNATLLDRGGFSLKGDLIGDYVNARLTDGGGPVPRIPPLRVRGGLEGAAGSFGGRIEVEHVFEQDRVATFENPTDDFTLVNASLSWHPFGDASETTLIVSANNIFDVDARRHASFTKDFVPLPGRDIRVAARFSF
ncbi:MULTISPECIES: TonB-dependent receptor [unclassified Sphingomonas]|uniref:TonB-dependent receptor n=1 Tax=unclassified Sphingomonas TaxID=196159 RepID=UPI00082BB3A6|nr:MULTISPECIES: TonB-dependent receptor [unclassified Sphingomonas]